MKRFSKKYKVIALMNSYHELSNSDSDEQTIKNTIEYCEVEIARLGFNMEDLPVVLDD